MRDEAVFRLGSKLGASFVEIDCTVAHPGSKSYLWFAFAVDCASLVLPFGAQVVAADSVRR